MRRVPRGRTLFACAVLCAGVIRPGVARADLQDTSAVAPPDTTAPSPADTTPPVYQTVFPIPGPEVPPGPLAIGTRYTFTRDSVLWSPALTVAELLANIPGVYVARGGFVGLPEPLQYGGRGGSAVRIYWDGVPMQPVGRDSLFVDPGSISLAYLRRVDVQVTPSELRVYLVSERHEERAARSVVRVQSGAFKTAAYTAMFQRRFANGVSLDLAGDFFGSDGPNRTAPSDHFDLWGKVGWMVSDHVGASYQVRRQRVDRDPVASASGGEGIPALAGSRTDYTLSLGMGTGEHELGWRGTVGVGATAWNSDSGSTLPDQSVRQAFADVAYRRAIWSAGVTARAADRRTPLSVEGEIGIAPIPWLVLSGDAFWRQHDADRHSRGAHGSVGLAVGPLSVTGDLSLRNAVQAPALLSDTAIRTLDWSARSGLDVRPAGVHVGLTRRAAFQPLSYPEFPGLPLGPTTASTFLVVDAQLRPASYFTLSGSYADPIRGTAPDLQPPAHVRAEATFRSKFLRTFRSGAFDFLAQVAVESWGDGTGGVSETGAAVPLDAATFWDMRLEFQLVSFTGFWELRNFRLSEGAFVPGLPFPKNAQRFGVTWEFRN